MAAQKLYLGNAFRASAQPRQTPNAQQVVLMMIGIVSDTHGHTGFTADAVRMLESSGVSQVIHCGDIGSVDVIRLFRPWPTHFVLGNVDSQAGPLEAAIRAAGQTCHGRFGELELDGRKVAFLHGDDERRLRDAIQSGQYDLVCYGHTHQAEHHKSGNTTVLNPGALYRADPHSLALVRLPELEVTHLTV